MPHDDLGSRLDGLAAAEPGPPPAMFVRRVTRRRWARRARVAAPLLAVAVVAIVAWRPWPPSADPQREVAILPVVSARPESLAALRRRLDAGDPRPGSGGWDGQGTLTPLDGYRAGGVLGAELSQ